MRKWTAALCIICGLMLTACNSEPSDGRQDDAAQNTEEDVNKKAAADGQQEASGSKLEDNEAALRSYEDAVPVVYMTDQATADSLLKLYQSMNKEISGENTAVSLSAGEALADGIPAPALLRELLAYVDGTVAVCAAAEDGSAFGTSLKEQAGSQGFAGVADVVVLDEEGTIELPVTDGTHLTETCVGNHFAEYDGILAVSHFKQHTVAGVQGAVKNISVGISSAEGKCLIYSAGSSRTDYNAGDGQQDAFLETMAEAATAVADALDGNIAYINILNRDAAGCGCNGDPAEPDVHDIGILASEDPVALDQACVDLIYMADGTEDFITRMEDRNAEYALEYAEQLGLGSSAYTLVTID